MGRYYCGSIIGKFTSEQGPDVFQYFGTSYNWYNYYMCGCDYDPSSNKYFCQDCYTSFKDVIDKHYEEDNTRILESDIIEHQNEPVGLKYCLTDYHIPHIVKILNTIEEKFGGKEVVNNIFPLRLIAMPYHISLV